MVGTSYKLSTRSVGTLQKRPIFCRVGSVTWCRRRGGRGRGRRGWEGQEASHSQQSEQSEHSEHGRHSGQCRHRHLLLGAQRIYVNICIAGTYGAHLVLGAADDEVGGEAEAA